MKLNKDISDTVWSLNTATIMRHLWQKFASSPLAKTILSGILTLGVVVLLLTQISITNVLNLFADLAYNWIALAIFLYLINNVGRVVRLRILLPNQRTRFFNLLLIVNTYTMFNYVLPAWTGEASLLYFLRKYENVSLDKGSAALVVGRIIDYLAVAVIFIVGAWLSLRQLMDADALLTTSILEVALAMILVAVLILASMVWWGQRLLNLIEWLINRLGLSGSPAVEYVLKALGKVITAFAAIHSFRRYSLAFLWSLCLWLTIFTRFYVFLRGLNLETPLLSTIVGSTFAVMSKSVPFVTFGGIGTHEAGWTIGFMLVGFDKITAISSGFAVNLLTLLTTIVLGISSLAILHFGNTLRHNAIRKIPLTLNTDQTDFDPERAR